MTTVEDTAKQTSEAWKHYADACCEHDCTSGKRACQEIQQLAVPAQRKP